MARGKGEDEEAVVIVCEAGADWLTDDGVRLMPGSREDWVGFHHFFCQCLDDWGLTYEVLPCDVTSLAERVAFVLRRQDEFKGAQGRNMEE